MQSELARSRVQKSNLIYLASDASLADLLDLRPLERLQMSLVTYGLTTSGEAFAQVKVSQPLH
jgi:hypothetical protein